MIDRNPTPPRVAPLAFAASLLLLVPAFMAHAGAQTAAAPGLAHGAVTSKGAFPGAVWIASGNHGCSGVLVARQWVLTQARCMAEDADGSATTVHLGSNDAAKDNQVRTVSQVFLNPSFEGAFKADQALLLLSAPVGSDKNLNGGFTPSPALYSEHVVELPSVKFTHILAAGDDLVVVGWHFEEGTATPSALRQVTMDAQTTTAGDCEDAAAASGLFDIFCGTNPSGSSLCEGDNSAVAYLRDNNQWSYYGLAIGFSGADCAEGMTVFTSIMDYGFWLRDTIRDNTPPATGTLALALSNAQPYPGVELVLSTKAEGEVGRCTLTTVGACGDLKGLEVVDATHVKVPVGAYTATVFGLSAADGSGVTVASAPGAAVTFKEGVATTLKASLSPLASKTPGEGWQVVKVSAPALVPVVHVAVTGSEGEGSCDVDAIAVTVSCEGWDALLPLNAPYFALAAPVTAQFDAVGLAPDASDPSSLSQVAKVVTGKPVAQAAGKIVHYRPALKLDNAVAAFSVAPSNAKGLDLQVEVDDTTTGDVVTCTLTAAGAFQDCTGPIVVLGARTLGVVPATGHSFDVRASASDGLLSVAKTGIKGAGKATGLTSALALDKQAAGFSLSISNAKAYTVTLTDQDTMDEGSCAVAADGTVSDCTGSLAAIGLRQVGVAGGAGHVFDVVVQDPLGEKGWSKTGVKAAGGKVASLSGKLAVL